MNDLQIEKRNSFKEIPKDSKWYELPNNIFVMWDVEKNMWRYMLVRDDISLYQTYVEDGAELYEAEQ
jgi:hypothetical protein